MANLRIVVAIIALVGFSFGCSGKQNAAAQNPSAAPATPAPRLASPVIFTCTGAPQREPTEYVIACGDGNYGLTNLRWSGWGRARAAATGDVHANDCSPNCAQGRFHDYPATAVVSLIGRVHGRLAYRRLVIRSTLHRQETYTLTCDGPTGEGQVEPRCRP